ncbi:Alpha/Beta hydrolase protein [Gorgonomyces haynaldii]|nr:Alpha/Beta hydrolase protein [Gorgonomyces haynaldii]
MLPPPAKQGIVNRGKHSIEYQIHGTGSTKICLIHGFQAHFTNWIDLIERLDLQKHSVLILNNRGIGKSEGGPWERYTTTGMAQDVLAVLDHIGWTQDRSVHLGGTSMGGMIAMELAYLATFRFKSLLLLSTCRKHRQPPKTIYDRMLFIKNIVSPPERTVESEVQDLLQTLFQSQDWLKQQSNGRTNRERLEERYRFLVSTHKGSSQSKWCQALGVATHFTSDHKLQTIGECMEVGIVVGDCDKLIDYTCSYELHSLIPGSRLKVLKGVGHAPVVEATEKVLEVLIDSIRISSERF